MHGARRGACRGCGRRELARKFESGTPDGVHNREEIQVTSCTKRSLFGGALFAAGLMDPAQGQNLVITETYAVCFAYEFYDYGFDWATVDFFGPIQISASVGNNYASAYATVETNGQVIRTETAVGGVGGQAYAGSVFTSFEVDQDMTVNVEWDFTDGLGRIEVHEVGFGMLLGEGGSSAGSELLTLYAGRAYSAVGYSQVYGEGGLAGHWAIAAAVPAPGAWGLLGLSVLSATRRPRR